MKKNYVYPDCNDKITATMIDEEEYNKGVGYWQRSEKRILNLMKKRIKKHIKKRDTWFLDAGCGEGRILYEFERYFDHIVLIDPDDKRLKLAEQLVKKLGLSKKVNCKTLPIELIEPKQEFNVILCNHVLQHVRTNHVKKILKKFYEILNKDGLLFITTCNSTRERDYFVKHFIKNSKSIEKIITKEEFNSLIYNEKKLPIHFFTKDNIIYLLESLNFKVLDFKKFHTNRDMFIVVTK